MIYIRNGRYVQDYVSNCEDQLPFLSPDQKVVDVVLKNYYCVDRKLSEAVCDVSKHHYSTTNKQAGR